MKSFQVDYNSHASIYDRSVAPALSPLADMLLDEVEFCGKGNIIDICSGTGLLLGKLIDRFPAASRFVGADLFDGMLRLFKFGNRDRSKVFFAAMDAERLAIASGTFSLATLQCGLQYLNSVNALSEIRRILIAPAGVAAVQGFVSTNEAFAPPHRRLTKIFAYLLEKHSTKSPSRDLIEARRIYAEKLSALSEMNGSDGNDVGRPEDLKQTALSVGFSYADCRTFTYCMQFQDADAFLQRMLFCTPSSDYYRIEYNEMDAQTQAAFGRALESNSNKHCRNAGGYIEESYIIFRLLART